MPPFIPRKRRQSTSPPDAQRKKPVEKPSLFDTHDKPGATGTVQDNKTFLKGLDGSDTDTSLSDISSAEFEDAIIPPSPKRRKIDHTEDEDEIDWEDAILPDKPALTKSLVRTSGDFELTLDQGTQLSSFTNIHDKKKGPSKIERQIRISTHCLHVQFLLFHNLIRNAWVCDKQVQNILVSQLPAAIRREVENWKLASGIDAAPVLEASNKSIPRGKGRRKAGKANGTERNQRDWGKPAERQEEGVPNMSRGDPVIRLLKILAAYWKKRFTITAPSLRKQGYKSLAQLEIEIASFQKDKHDAKKYGERLRGIQDFRDLTKRCEGSKDVGAQLFTALLRGLGLETRLVASLQPVGFGWGKSEDAIRLKKKSSITPLGGNGESSSDEVASIETTMTTLTASNSAIAIGKRKGISTGKTAAPATIADSPSGGSVKANVEDDDDDSSLVDITPTMPSQRPNMNFDRDSRFPTYWSEVVSPITHKVYPVDHSSLDPAVATKPEHLSLFESRGASAEKARQVFAYAVAFSSDGTAKDVTVRYLKRHMWPGRTRGARIPIEKVPVYNRKGKIKHYEEYDWFKTVMSGYKRTEKMRSALDDLEEVEDLRAQKLERKKMGTGEDTLQGYKSSAEFVLERHLRREEALLPGSQPVKSFVVGKGDTVKEELVFRREDVVVCRTGESWHKEGRHVKAGEHPMKMVPVRAVTLTRKREVEEAQRDGGEKLKQGLYSWDQTDWIIPPPIENGVIPKNAFGNMDCYVPTMVPKGAVHIPLKSTVKICKKLGIDYAEAVTGFEFGKQRAVPVITGVCVAAEYEDMVIEAWKKDEEERRIKAEGKRATLALAMWRRFLMGLRIVERVREEYGGDSDGHLKEKMNPFTNVNKTYTEPPSDLGLPALVEEHTLQQQNDDMAGGFVVDEAGEDEAIGATSINSGKIKSGSSPLVSASTELETMSTGLSDTAVDLGPSEGQPWGKQKHKTKRRDTNVAAPHENKSTQKPVIKRSKINKKSGRVSDDHVSEDEPTEPQKRYSSRRSNTARALSKRSAAKLGKSEVRSRHFAYSSEAYDESNSDDPKSENSVDYKPTGKTGRARKVK